MFKFSDFTCIDGIRQTVFSWFWGTFKQLSTLQRIRRRLLFGSFLDTFPARSFKLCLGITFKLDIYMRVLMTLVKFHRHSNFGNILKEKRFSLSPLPSSSCVLVSGLLLISLWKNMEVVLFNLNFELVWCFLLFLRIAKSIMASLL